MAAAAEARVAQGVEGCLGPVLVILRPVVAARFEVRVPASAAGARHVVTAEAGYAASALERCIAEPGAHRVVAAGAVARHLWPAELLLYAGAELHHRVLRRARVNALGPRLVLGLVAPALATPLRIVNRFGLVARIEEPARPDGQVSRDHVRDLGGHLDGGLGRRRGVDD